jgi:hypothetical protein
LPERQRRSRVAGTTGEAPVLDDEKLVSLWAAVIEAVTIPVVAGTGSNDTRHSVQMTKEAKALGAAGCSPCARTTTARRRPASPPTCGPCATPATCR